MLTEPWNWTKDDIEKLFGQPESLRLDFKQSRLLTESLEKIAGNLSREVSAFVNTEGGVIVIGIVERTEGKSRIADHLDDGVDIRTWSSERLQQLIEGNVSPFLSGLRVRGIPLDVGKTKYAFAIYVPEGTTAYQASDRRYYGRSEFESKALPDHEIRLLMFRGKAPSATIRGTNWRKDTVAVTTTGPGFGFSELFEKKYAQEIARASPSEPFMVDHYRVDLVVENIGEINISEFKVGLKFSSNKLISSLEERWDFRDGWSDPRSVWGFPGDRTPHPMRVNIYPKDVFTFMSPDFHVPAEERLGDSEIVLDWTLYLPDSLPTQGDINLTREFEKLNAKDTE